ncbi:MAG: sialate O-acetylesterase [Ruminococcaceae bacterium]|nr:sialate O-acetylesterase [Oscillospiraceae bacterium]
MKTVLANEAFDIILVGGQSNSSGYGEGPVTKEYIPNERILMMENDAVPYYDFPKEENSPYKFIMKFLNPAARNTVRIADEVLCDYGKISNLGIIFAENYAKECLEPGRKVLLIDSGYGGTGFTCPGWGVGNPLHNRMLEMVRLALSCNSQNRLVAFIWHQGEHDVVENLDTDPEKLYRFHKANLSAALKDFYTQFDCTDVPFFTAGFCNEWYLTHKTGADAVLKAIRECAEEIGGIYLDTSDLTSNNQVLSNGDVIHFSRESQHILSKRFFDKYIEMMKKSI